MTRDMATILTMLDAMISDEDREFMLLFLKELEEYGATSSSGIDDIRQTLDIFGATLSIRREPKRHFPNDHAIERRGALKLLVADHRSSREKILPKVERLSRYKRDPVI